MDHMDVTWFKSRMRAAGIRNADVAQRAGKTVSNVSNIFAGSQQMGMAYAQAFAELLDVPVEEVLRRAGVMPRGMPQTPTQGFSDGDAAPFIGIPGATARLKRIAQAFGVDRAGVDAWTVNSVCMTLNGLLPGDTMLIDSNLAERAAAGDVVIAQQYDAQAGSATTLLRRLEPPVLVAASPLPDDQRAIMVDGLNVVVRGVMVASWRMRD